MRSFSMALIAAVCSLSLTSDLRAEDKNKITVVQVTQDPTEIARSVLSMLSEAEVQIVADARAGTLFVRGAAADTERAITLIDSLDVQPSIVNFFLTIEVKPTDGDKAKIVDEFRLATLDGNEASVQVGQEVSVVEGYSHSPRSSKLIAQTSRKSVGTAIEVRPQVRNGRVLTALVAEKTWVEAISSDTETSIPGNQVFTAVLNTTLALKPGEKQTIEMNANGGTDSGRSIVLTISATHGEGSRRSADMPRSAPERSSSRRGRTRPDSARRPSAGSPGGRGNSGGRSTTGSAQSAGTSIAERLFSRMDKDNDGHVAASEFDSQTDRMLERLEIKKRKYSREEFVKVAAAALVKHIGDRDSSGSRPKPQAAEEKADADPNKK